jgi:hypothetical protein
MGVKEVEAGEGEMEVAAEEKEAEARGKEGEVGEKEGEQETGAGSTGLLKHTCKPLEQLAKRTQFDGEPLNETKVIWLSSYYSWSEPNDA